MALIDLPNELLIQIVEYLEYGWDLNAVGLVNRRFHNIANSQLYERKLPPCSENVLKWAFLNGKAHSVTKCLEADALNHIEGDLDEYFDILLLEAADTGKDQALELLLRNSIIPSYLKPENHNAPCKGQDGGDSQEESDEDEGCPFCVASRRRHVSFVRALIKNGANILHPGGEHPMLIAMKNPHVKKSGTDKALLNLLIHEAGFDPNERYGDGFTPLGWAIDMNQHQSVECLLQNGADPNLATRSKHGMLRALPLHLTSDVDIFKCLVSHGALLNIDFKIVPMTTSMEICPLMRAISANRFDLAREVAQQMDSQGTFTQLCEKDQSKALYVAIILKKDQEVQMLQKQVDWVQDPPNTKNESVESLLKRHLICAAKLGSKCLVKTILARATTLNIDTEELYMIALNMTIVRGKMDRRGPEEDCGDAEMARMIIETATHREKYPDLPGLLQFSLRNTSVAEVLLEYGVDPNTTIVYKGVGRLTLSGQAKERDKTILEHALKSGKTDFAQILINQGALLHSSALIPPLSLVKAASDGGIPMLDLIFKNGFDLEQLSTEDKCATMKYAWNIGYSVFNRGHAGHVVFTFLLQTGSITLQKDEIHYYTECAAKIWVPGSPEPTPLDIMLQKYDDINLKDKDGRTCLMRILWQKPDLLIVKRLLKKGADPLLTCNDGETALCDLLTSNPAFYNAHGRHTSKIFELLLGAIDITWSKHPRNEVYKAVIAAESRAIVKEAWQSVRVLQRFRFLHLQDMRR
ncbi:ankyrin [Penicillium angulare]|uniref:Ankyrin n=1 Tax=Penicillium angulare TaxID=116970 RepID=A0A9W9KKA5_9EURO|nr:ankyrin [Penicillium angulare]